MIQEKLNKTTLYGRLGGYEGISIFATKFLARLQTDRQLGRFWANRGSDGIARETLLLIDFLCANAGGPQAYNGRDMVSTHRGMGITESDWAIFFEHAAATMDALELGQRECDEIVALISSHKDDIIELSPPPIKRGATIERELT
ncbi:MAG: group 1 truncated hemoglobin [Maricaulis sp.]|jgi:hemoglobin|nr:group 1 truncated hemoglobin [Maricaulis sp.]